MTKRFLRDKWSYMKYRLRCYLARHPILLNAVYSRLSRHSHLLINENTQLVIEGYPRSGNTFALRAFSVNNQNFTVAHHMHAQAQVIQAVRRQLPVIVLYRSPSDAVSSLVVRHPFVSVRQALRAYCQFYEDIYPFHDGYLLASFEEVTENFGDVIERTNIRFGTKFNTFIHNKENVNGIYEQMENANRAYYGELKITHIPRPDPERTRIKSKINLQGYPDLYRRCVDIYCRLKSLDVRQVS